MSPNENKPRRMGKRQKKQITKMRGYKTKPLVCERISQDLEARMIAGEEPFDLREILVGFVQRHEPLEISFEGVIGFVEEDDSGEHWLAVCFKATCKTRFRLQAGGENAQVEYMGLRVGFVFESLADGGYEYMRQNGEISQFVAEVLGEEHPLVCGAAIDEDEAELNELLREANQALAAGDDIQAAKKVADLERKGHKVCPPEVDGELYYRDRVDKLTPREQEMADIIAMKLAPSGLVGVQQPPDAADSSQPTADGPSGE
jgi:hypothetical protein